MSNTATTPHPGAIESIDHANEVQRLRQENARLREALEDVLVILGDPVTYHEDDRTEVAHAVGRAKRSLGLAPPRRRVPVPLARPASQEAG